MTITKLTNERGVLEMIMWHRYSTVLCIVIALGLTGCSAYSPNYKGELFKRNGVSMIVTPANVSATFFNDSDSSERHCLSPSADVSLTENEGVSIGSKLWGSVGGGTGQGAVSLGGRNPAVLITRELMYRACELTSNLDLAPERTIAVYERFLQAVENIARTQTWSGTTASSMAAPPLQSQETASNQGGNEAEGSDSQAGSTEGNDGQSDSTSEDDVVLKP